MTAFFLVASSLFLTTQRALHVMLPAHHCLWQEHSSNISGNQARYFYLCSLNPAWVTGDTRILEEFLESSVLMEITAPFTVPCWGHESKPVPVKLRLRRRKTGKQMKSRVQNVSYQEGMMETGCLCLKEGQRQPGKDRLTHTTNIGEVITCMSLVHEFLTVIYVSFVN